jgi:mRNA degradation ribonuclease J1/J2
VLALFSDSTNADHGGHTQSERTGQRSLRIDFPELQGTDNPVCVPSSIPRLQLANRAWTGNSIGVVAFLGRRMVSNTEVPTNSGF